MTGSFSGSEARFNIERAVKCAEAYSFSTGIQTAVINCDGQMLHNSCPQKSICTFCDKVQEVAGERLNCKDVHIYGSYQAERFGGKYVFFCPFGLTHWISPIIADGLKKGSILAGPVLMMDPDDFLMEDLIRKNGIEERYLEELKRYIYKIPIVKPDVVDKMAELLFITTSHVSDQSQLHYMDNRDLLEQQSNISEYIHYIKTLGGDDKSLQSYPIEKEKELLSMISLGDSAGARAILNEIFGYIFFSMGGDFEAVKARVLELVVLLSRAALEGGAGIEEIFGLNYTYLNEIHSFKTVEELTYWLSKIMTRFSDCVFNFADIKHADVIYKAIEYIKKNYMKKITLEEVASHVYLSSSYFSKVFKEETGYNFVTYLNQLRVKISQNLLLDDSIDLVEISNMVGYEDQSYFSKTFKKLTGVTPGRYRESRGRKKPVDTVQLTSGN